MKQCLALTKEGKGPQCTRKAPLDSPFGYCKQHQKSYQVDLAQEIQGKNITRFGLIPQDMVIEILMLLTPSDLGNSSLDPVLSYIGQNALFKKKYEKKWEFDLKFSLLNIKKEILPYLFDDDDEDDEVIPINHDHEYQIEKETYTYLMNIVRPLALQIYDLKRDFGDTNEKWFKNKLEKILPEDILGGALGEHEYTIFIEYSLLKFQRKGLFEFYGSKAFDRSAFRSIEKAMVETENSFYPHAIVTHIFKVIIKNAIMMIGDSDQQYRWNRDQNLKNSILSQNPNKDTDILNSPIQRNPVLVTQDGKTKEHYKIQLLESDIYLAIVKNKNLSQILSKNVIYLPWTHFYGPNLRNLIYFDPKYRMLFDNTSSEIKIGNISIEEIIPILKEKYPQGAAIDPWIVIDISLSDISLSLAYQWIPNIDTS